MKTYFGSFTSYIRTCAKSANTFKPFRISENNLADKHPTFSFSYFTLLSIPCDKGRFKLENKYTLKANVHNYS